MAMPHEGRWIAIFYNVRGGLYHPLGMIITSPDDTYHGIAIAICQPMMEDNDPPYIVLRNTEVYYYGIPIFTTDSSTRSCIYKRFEMVITHDEWHPLPINITDTKRITRASSEPLPDRCPRRRPSTP